MRYLIAFLSIALLACNVQAGGCGYSSYGYSAPSYGSSYGYQQPYYPPAQTVLYPYQPNYLIFPPAAASYAFSAEIQTSAAAVTLNPVFTAPNTVSYSVSADVPQATTVLIPQTPAIGVQGQATVVTPAAVSTTTTVVDPVTVVQPRVSITYPVRNRAMYRVPRTTTVIVP